MGKELGLFLQSGEKNLGCSFHGKRNWVVHSIREKDLGCSFNQGKRTWVVPSIRGKELELFIQYRGKELRSFIQSRDIYG